MVRSNIVAFTLALVVAMFFTAEADAQRGRGWRRGSGDRDQVSGQGYGRGWDRRDQNPAGGAGCGCLFGWRMSVELDLTDSQKAAVAAIYAKLLEDTDPLFLEFNRLEEKIWDLDNSAQSDDGVVDGLVKLRQKLRAKIDSIWGKYEKKALGLLTKKQRLEYNKIVESQGSYGRRCCGPGLRYGCGAGRCLRWGRDGPRRGRGGRGNW